MRDEPWLEDLREAVRRMSELSPDEFWDDMVRRGIIDEEGRVLIRMPQPPKPPKQNKKKPRKAAGGNGEG
jgi:hypothetical protein